MQILKLMKICKFIKIECVNMFRFLSNNSNEKGKKQDQEKMKSLKSKLNQLLVKKIIPKGISQKYLTSNTHADLVDVLLETSSKFFSY